MGLVFALLLLKCGCNAFGRASGVRVAVLLGIADVHGMCYGLGTCKFGISKAHEAVISHRAGGCWWGYIGPGCSVWAAGVGIIVCGVVVFTEHGFGASFCVF